MDAVDAAPLLRTERAVLLACAGTVTLAAWLTLPAHRHPQTDWRGFVLLVAMWQAMTVAMMTPSVLAWLLTFAALAGRNEKSRRRFGRVVAFAGGYFTVWLGYSILAAGLQTVLHRAGFPVMNGRLPTRAGGAVLMAAGLVYFTPFRRACLRHCRNPLTYFLSRWRNGPRSGFGFGLSHGAYCVGCCWALMLTGFAVGVMNILWMAFLTVLICTEKLAPQGERIGAVAAAGMTIWGLVLLF